MIIDNLSGAVPKAERGTPSHPPRHADPYPQFTSQPATSANNHVRHAVEDVEEAVRDMNEFMRISSPSIHFTLDNDTGRTVVKMIDKETNEVVRQIPSVEALAISKALDRLQGLILQVKA
jgi:flagellar protein FlaG